MGGSIPTRFRIGNYSLCLPAVKKQSGNKVIIGDNLSSHLDKSIIKACEKENIRFVFLPPNTTHLTQPLNVAYYRSVKYAWRAILSEWKEKTNSSTTLPKDEFLPLLKKLVEKVNITGTENLISGFRACGIVLVDRNKVLDKQPSRRAEAIPNQVLNDSVMDLLRERNTSTASSSRRRTRMNVEPGRSVSTDDFPGSDSDSSNDDEIAGPSHEEPQPENSTSSEEETEIIAAPASSMLRESTNFSGVFRISENAIKPGQWLLVNFAPDASRLKAYIGQVETIISRRTKDFEASFVRSKSQRLLDKDLFVYPEEWYICEFSFDQVIGRVEPPKILRRGELQFAVNSHEW